MSIQTLPAATDGLPGDILSGLMLARLGGATNADAACQDWDAAASAVAKGLQAMIRVHAASSEVESAYWADIVDAATCSLVHTRPSTEIGRGALLAYALAQFDHHIGVFDPLTGIIRNALASALEGIGGRIRLPDEIDAICAVPENNDHQSAVGDVK